MITGLDAHSKPVQVVDKVQSGILKDAIYSKVITTDNTEKINVIATDLYLKARPTIKLIEINNIIEYSAGREPTPIDKHNRYIKIGVIGINIDQELVIRELNIRPGLNAIPIQRVRLHQRHGVLLVHCFEAVLLDDVRGGGQYHPVLVDCDSEVGVLCGRGDYLVQ